MNKLGLSSNLVCIKYSRPLVIFGFEGQNLGTLLENKVHLELKLWKYVNIKSWAPFFIFFNEKQIGKIPSIFDIEKWLWKSESPYIWPSKAKQTKGLEFLYTHQVEAEAKLIDPWTQLSCSSEVTLTNSLLNTNWIQLNSTFIMVDNFVGKRWVDLTQTQVISLTCFILKLDQIWEQYWKVAWWWFCFLCTQYLGFFAINLRSFRSSFKIRVTIMCRNDELSDELSWLFTNRLSVTR